MTKTREQLEKEAYKWGNKYDRSIGAKPESLDYSDMPDEELTEFTNTIKGQARFNFWYPIVIFSIVLIVIFFISKLF